MSTNILNSFKALICRLDGLWSYINIDVLSFCTVLLSVFCSIAALFCSILNSYFKNDVNESNHLFALGSYQLIAQKARMIRWPDMDYQEMVRVVKGLEENFQLLKARGREPTDSEFNAGHKLFRKISQDEVSSSAQSFQEERENEERVSRCSLLNAVCRFINNK